MSAKKFFDTLAASFQVKKIAVGTDFHFGNNREGDSAALKKMCAGIGAFCQIVSTVRYKGLRVSSTRIRHAIREGNLTDARAMLAGAYRVIVPENAAQSEQTRTVIRREALKQVVPERGRFQVTLDVDGRTFPGSIAIHEDLSLIHISEPTRPY